MDSNFQYASTVRWHRATDLPLPPAVKPRSAGRPPPHGETASEAQAVFLNKILETLFDKVHEDPLVDRQTPR